MKTIRKILNLFILSILGGLLPHCANDKIAGNTSETDNAAVHGVLYREDGQLAKNAEVKLITVDHRPGPNLAKSATVVTTVYTNEQGVYAFNSYLSGFYNIICKDNGEAVFIDSVYLKRNDVTKVDKYTLRNPGSLHGVVRLQPGDDNRSVLIILFGTDIFTTPVDTTGKFDLSSIPDGRYNARIFTLNTAGTYEPLDTVFVIRSGQMDTLQAPIYPKLTSIPVVTGLHIEWDSVREVASLTWNKSTSPVVKGYNVYRMHQDSNYTPLSTQVLTDTSYQDGLSNVLIPDKKYYYKVVAVDADVNQGAMSNEVSVLVTQAYKSTLLSGINGWPFLMNNLGYCFVKDTNNNVKVYDPGFSLVKEFNIQLYIKKAGLIFVDNSGNTYYGTNYGYNLDSTIIVKIDFSGNFVDSIRINKGLDLLNIKFRNDTIFYKIDNSDKTAFASLITGIELGSFNNPPYSMGGRSYPSWLCAAEDNGNLAFSGSGTLISTDLQGNIQNDIIFSLPSDPIAISGDTILTSSYYHLVIPDGFVLAGFKTDGTLLFKYVIMSREYGVYKAYVHDGKMTVVLFGPSVIRIAR